MIIESIIGDAVKLPERGPTIKDVLSSLGRPARFAELAPKDGVSEIMQRANQEYLPWEDFKYKSSHPQFTSEELWGLVKLSRFGSRKTLPVTDVNGVSFTYWLPDSALESLHRIDQSVGAGFLVQDLNLPEEAKEQYLISSLMEEAIASSQIEGAATTRPVAKEMLRKNRKPRNRSDQMILNNYHTVRALKETAKEPISVERLNIIHRMITKDTLDDPRCSGRFRTEEEPINVISYEGQVLHIPPKASVLDKQMQFLTDFGNASRTKEFIHPVVRAIILHFWLAYLHPYVDGNGRTARALFYWSMLRHRYWLLEYLSISRVILRLRAQYLRAFLHTEHDDNDLTYFITFHLKAMTVAIQELEEYLRRKTKEQNEALKLLKKARWLNYRQRALVQHALKHPDFVYTIESHRMSHNISYATARSDLIVLAKKDFLVVNQSGRSFEFLAVADLRKKLTS